MKPAAPRHMVIPVPYIELASAFCLFAFCLFALPPKRKVYDSVLVHPTVNQNTLSTQKNGRLLGTR